MPLPVLSFSVFSGACVSETQWQEAAELFSREYGFYSQHAPDGKAGRPIRLGAGYYRRAYANDSYRVAFCRAAERLVGQIVYCEYETSRGKVAFVVQLVVDSAYRRKGIASTLLHAVWGFSDFCAWGIVTSNAFTVEALESATFRKAAPKLILAHADWIRNEVLDKVPFLRGIEWRISESESRANTRFFTDRSGATPSTLELSNRLGTLAEGEEWLAITFREQVPDLAKIFTLRPSDTMQRDGEYFDANYILVDEERHLVCHKEQFPGGAGSLPGEYLIRDRRFTAEEIAAWAHECGLHVLERHFVRAGFTKEYTEATAKEILLVTKKAIPGHLQ